MKKKVIFLARRRRTYVIYVWCSMESMCMVEYNIFTMKEEEGKNA